MLIILLDADLHFQDLTNLRITTIEGIEKPVSKHIGRRVVKAMLLYCFCFIIVEPIKILFCLVNLLKMQTDHVSLPK